MMWTLLHWGIVDASIVDKPWDGSTWSMRYLAVLVGRLWGLLAGERTRVSLHSLFQLNQTDLWLLLRGIIWSESSPRWRRIWLRLQCMLRLWPRVTEWGTCMLTRSRINSFVGSTDSELISTLWRIGWSGQSWGQGCWNWRMSCYQLVWTAWSTSCASAPGQKLLPRWVALDFLIKERLRSPFRLTKLNPSLSMPMGLQTIHHTSRLMLNWVFPNKLLLNIQQMFPLWFYHHQLMQPSCVALAVRFLMSQWQNWFLSSSQSFDMTFAWLFFFILLSPTLHIHSLILSLFSSYLFMWPYLILPIISHSLPHTLYLFFKSTGLFYDVIQDKGGLSTCMKEGSLHWPTQMRSECPPTCWEALEPCPQ